MARPSQGAGNAVKRSPARGFHADAARASAQGCSPSPTLAGTPGLPPAISTDLCPTGLLLGLNTTDPTHGARTSTSKTAFTTELKWHQNC